MEQYVKDHAVQNAALPAGNSFYNDFWPIFLLSKNKYFI